jgi:hypothetical protein
MIGALLVGAGALAVALVAGALLDFGDEGATLTPPVGHDDVRRITLQLEPPPRCCG